MKRESELLGRKNLWIFLLTEVLILIWICAGWTGNGIQIEFSGEELIYTSGMYQPQFMGGGWYIDSTFGAVEGVVSSPKVDMGAGTYIVTICYSAQGNGQTYSVSADNADYRIITGMEDRKLRCEVEEETFQVWLNRQANGYTVQVNYNGAGYLLIRSISIMQTDAYFGMRLTAGLVLGSLVLIWFTSKQRRCSQQWDRENRILYVGIVVTVFIASVPLFSNYLINGHDLPFHLLRIEGIAEGLRAGQIPVRIQPGWFDGYGYASSIFYGELFLYFPAILRLIGFPLQTSYKIFVIVVNLVTCTCAVYGFHHICRNRYVALTGGILYTLTPYRLGNIYIRGAVGEYTAMIFLPFLAIGLYGLLKREIDSKESGKYTSFLVIGFTGILQSHLITCEMAGSFTFLICLLFIGRIFRKNRWRYFLISAGITVLINLWFLVPFVIYSLSGRFQVVEPRGTPHIQTYGAFLNQLFDFFPNGSGSAYTIYERFNYENIQMPLTVGMVLIGLMIGNTIYCFVLGKDAKGQSSLRWFCTALACLAFWMSTAYFPWDALGDLSGIPGLLVRNLQFGWRFLSIASVLLAILSCLFLDELWSDYRMRFTVPVCVCAGFLLGGWMVSAIMHDSSWGLYRDRSEIQQDYVTSLEYVPKGTNRTGFQDTKPSAEEQVVLQEYENKNGIILLKCKNADSEQSRTILLPVLYYEGYEGTSAEGEVSVESGENNRILVTVAPGFQGTIEVKFHEPSGWRVASILSLLSVVCIFIFIIKRCRGGRSEKRNMFAGIGSHKGEVVRMD